MTMKNLIRISATLSAFFLFAGCSPDHEDGLKDDYAFINVSPALIASGLNYPCGLEFINNSDADGTGQGSVLGQGNLLIANRGSVGLWANSVVQVDPHNGQISLYSDSSRLDLNQEKAVDNPFDVAFAGPFAWIANDSGGLGSVSITDPNPSKSPNGPSGQAGDPVDGPTGTGVFGSNDFGFIILSAFPEDGAEPVPQSTKIQVVFSQPVNPATVTHDTFNVQVDYSDLSPDPADPEGEFLFSPDFTQLEFAYTGYLAEATRYKIFLDKDVTDFQGMPLDGDLTSPGPDDFESFFTTGSGNPRVNWVNPGNGASDVAIDAIIEVGFSEPIRDSSVTTSSFLLLDQEGDKIDGEVSVHEEATRARLVPDEPLERNAVYHVQVLSHVEDLAGNPLDQNPGGYPDPFESSFSTGTADNTPPYVATISPEDKASGVSVSPIIIITFSEPISQSSLIGQYFTLSHSSGGVPGSITWTSEITMEFDPSTDLSEDTLYTVRISDVVTDNTGNKLDGDRNGSAGGEFISAFTTESERLYVVSSFPENGSSGISIGTYVYVNFSKPVNPSTVNASTFIISLESNPSVAIPATV